MSKIQLLKLFNLEESPEVNPPGDLRLWKALEQALPSIKFLRFRVIGVEWDDATDFSHLDVNKWNELIGVSGLASVSVSEDCEFPCLQRRRMGERSSDLENLIEELLKLEKLPLPLEIWEADHYELMSSSEVEVLEENVQKLLDIGPRSGLLDADREEIRFVSQGESWSWKRRSGFLDTLRELSLDDLIDRWREMHDDPQIPDPMRRSYTIREQQARSTAQSRDERSFLERWTQIEEARRSPEIDEIETALLRSAPETHLLHFHRFCDQKIYLNEARGEILNRSVLSDSSVGNLLWADDQTCRVTPKSLATVFQSFSRKIPASSFHLYALRPLSRDTAIPWRRLSSLMSMSSDLIAGGARHFSGDEPWIVAYRNFVAAHKGWEVPEESVRMLFEFEAERVSRQIWLMFFSNWSFERLKDAFGAYGFEVFEMGHAIDEVDALRIRLRDKTTKDIAWLEIFSKTDLGSSAQRVDKIQWTAPDLKSPTYGFEKVSIFPDQYLLRAMNYGVKGETERLLRNDFSGSAHSRESLTRNTVAYPVGGHKWSAGSKKIFADGVGRGSPLSSASPRDASRVALDIALRNVVARGVSPYSPLFMSAYLPRPRSTQSAEKDLFSYGAYALGAEGLLESAEELKNLVIAEIDFDSYLPAGREYQVEPFVHLRGEVASGAHSAFSGFRMSGESLYAIGPRPAFMDIGSRVLQHVRVMSNHVTHLSWSQQFDLYHLIHQCLCEQIITDIRPIGWGGVAETLLEMALWSGIGVQLKPSLSTVDLFSACPGRFIVGILPQEAKRFEAMVKGELLTPVGTSGGEKLFGLPLEKYKEARAVKS